VDGREGGEERVEDAPGLLDLRQGDRLLVENGDGMAQARLPRDRRFGGVASLQPVRA